MIIKINNRQFLLTIGAALCCSAMAAQAASSRAEAPPPWAGNAVGNARLASVATPRVGTQKNSSIETWYRNRQRATTQVNSNLGNLQAQADAGDDNALYQLGLIYQSGRGVTQNIPLAQQLFDKSARAGNAYAQYALALLYRAKGDQASIQRSVRLQEGAAQKGLAEAQYGLGMLYANGQYVGRDLYKARHWLEQSASRGNMMATLSLKDLPREAAVPRQTRAVPAVQPIQQIQPVRPVPRQVTQAPPVFRPKPVAQRPVQVQTAHAEPKLAAMPAEMTQVATVNQNESRVNLEGMSPVDIRREAEHGNKYAQLMLGALYEDGSDGVQKNHEMAMSWYLKAARQGYPKAQHNLALLYEDGRGIEQSYRQAAIWYKKAAQAGFSEAQNNLAVLYILGNGVDEDRDYAEQLLRQASAQGNSNAQRNLKMLMEGAG